MSEQVFLDTSLVLGIAIGVAFLIRILRQPLIISYIITGIICGPLFFNLINSSQEYFDIFAEFGVILLLFLVGLSLNIDYLRKIGKVATFTGVGQVIFTSIIGFLLLIFIGFSRNAALFLSISITFSSTIIIIKLLADKHESNTVYGRYTLGLMLVQDIIAIVIMIFLPTFQSGSSMLITLGLLIVKVTFFLAVIYVLSKVILPIIVEKAATSGEFLLLFALAWCFAIAGLGEWAGLTLEVGAIMAGLSLGSSAYQTEISSRIRPLRDFFIALFFIILGSEMNLDNFSASIWPGLVLSIFVMLGNPLILYFLYRRMKFTRRSSFLAGLTAAQVSEFGFVFLFVAQQMGYINGNIISIFTLVALITIFVSSYVITYNSQIFRWFNPFLSLFGRDHYKNPKNENVKYDVLVFGYHRLGWRLCQVLKEMKISFAVVDFDPEVITKLKNSGIPSYFGDATDIELLTEIPIEQSKMIISTLPSYADQVVLVKYARRKNNKAIIIGNLSHIKFLNDMYEAGADYVMVPHLLGGHWMADVLQGEPWKKATFKRLVKSQKIELNARIG